MSPRLRLWLQSSIDATVADQAATMKAQVKRLCDLERERDDLAQERDSIKAKRNKLLGLLNAVLKAIDLPVSSISTEWLQTPSIAGAAVGSHIDARLQTIELRASKAEKDAEDLKDSALEKDREIARLQADLDVANEQNEHLWDLVQRDRARVAAETAIANRTRAENELAGKRPAASDEEIYAVKP